MEINNANINPKAIEVCRVLKKAGFQAFLVGGCVRDLILGNHPKDWDITTNAIPELIMKTFPKTYPTGIDHGTITVSMGSGKDDMFEVTTYRGEGAYTDGRRPDSVNFINDIEGDLARRDLTINAMAYDPIDHKLVDPFNGIKDLDDKMIRAVGDPNQRFSEDGLRTMRVARFASRLGFDIDPDTENAIVGNLDVLNKVSKERMRDELVKTLATKKPSIGLSILFRTGALGVLGKVFSATETASTFSQIDECNGDVETKVAILLHHMGTSQLENELRGLKFSNIELKKISFLSKKLNQYKSFESNPNVSEAKKFLSSIKNDTIETYDKSLDEFFAFGKSLHLHNLDKLKSFSLEKIISKKEMDISGEDLIRELGLKPGPQIKKVLDKLYESVVETPDLNHKEHLIELAKRFEKIATTVYEIAKVNYKLRSFANKPWWRLTEDEDKDLLDKEFDFGNGLKFKNKDIPNLRDMIEVPAGPEAYHPEKNQLLHNNLVYDQAKKLSDDPKVWYAALMHDLGKVHTDKDIWPKQHGHEELGVSHVEQVSNDLGVPEDWKEIAKLVARFHLTGHRAKQLTPKTLKKLFDMFNGDKNKFNIFLKAIEADHRGRHGNKNSPYEEKDILNKYWEEGLPIKTQNQSSQVKMEITGNDLMKELGLNPGQQLGDTLKKLRTIIEKDPNLNNKDILIELARKIVKIQ